MKIDELHEHIFETLCTIDDICKKENVSYYVDFGTAIGAVREKDLIPWDDDADLGVKIENYDAFKKAMIDHLPPYMHFIEATAFSPLFYDFVARIYDERYQIRESSEEDDAYSNLQNYIGTDVFVSSRIPERKWAQKIYFFRSKVIYGMAMGHRYGLERDKYSMLQWLQIRMLALVGKMFSVETIWKLWDKNRRKYPFSPYRAGLDASVPGWKPIPAELFEGKEVYGEIRGRKFPLIPGYDRYLRLYYGDYMKPPKNFDTYVHHTSKEEEEILRDRWAKAQENESAKTDENKNAVFDR